MIDGPATAGLTVSERLQKLREYSRRYCTSDFVRDSDEDLGRQGDPSSRACYTARENLIPISLGSSTAYELWKDGARSLMVYSPPSLIENREAWRWTISLPPSYWRAPHVMAVDVAQNIAVVGTLLANNACVWM